MSHNSNHLIYLSDLINDNSESTITSVHLKQGKKVAANNTVSVSILHSVLYSLNDNTSDISEITNTLESVLSAQCTDKSSDFFGLFPYSLSIKWKEYNSPDYDFQASLLVPLLKIYLEHYHKFSQDLITRLTDALTTIGSVIAYTPTSIDSHNYLLSVLSLQCIGETFKIPQFILSAINKMHYYYHFIQGNNCFPLEYNSPYYIIRQLESIRFFNMYISDPDIKQLLTKLNTILLSVLYRHYNPHLRQWTGPFSLLNHSKNATDKLIENIYEITNQPKAESFNVPDEFHNISPLYEDRFERLLVSKGLCYPHYKPCMAATVYNTRSFSLCSFNHDDMWKARIPCIAYFGNKDPHCIYVECLLNGFPFTSGAFHSIQHKESLLGHINFSTNRGYKAMDADVSNSYKTKDLRIRLCIEGNTDVLKISENESGISVEHKKLLIYFNVIHAVFDKYKVTYEYTLHENALYFDIILYNGKEINLELTRINNAILSFYLYIGEKKQFSYYPVETYDDETFLYSSLTVKDATLKLKSHKSPANYEIIFSQDAQYINDENIYAYLDRINAFSKHHEFFLENNNKISNNLLAEKNIHNKKIIKKIVALNTYQLKEVSPSIKKIFQDIEASSINETKHYAVLILRQLYSLATQTDIRFIKLIQHKYASIYNRIITENDKKQLRKIIINTVNDLNDDYKNFKSGQSSDINNIINEIIRIMHSRFTDPNLSFQNIVRNYAVSESYISRKFSEILGISYVQYLTNLRVNKAIELLNEMSDISDIHIKCGYYNIQTFHTAFKKITGLTVRGYIKQNIETK